MQKRLYIALFLGSLAIVSQAAVPWQSIETGNAYWAKVLGVEARLPETKSFWHESEATEIRPDASIRLVNAGLRYQIDHLPNNELKRFADSLMHVIIYLSGASPVQADGFDRAGWWRLSYPVAMRYGLTVNKFVDERNNFQKSTQAALRYIKDLQRELGENWLPAFVEDPILASRMTRHHAQLIGKDLDATYKLMVISAYTNSESYAVQNFYQNVDSWKTNEQILADLIIEKSGISRADFYALNPEISGNIIPEKSTIVLTSLALAVVKKNKEDIILLSDARLEEGDEKLLAEKERIIKNVPDPTKIETTVYKVRSGDNLGYISEKYGVGVSQLRSWNNLRNDNIYIGQKLMIYSEKDRQSITAANVKKAKKDEQVVLAEAVLEKGDFISYKVKTGDTLWSIAKQFPGVSPDNLMAWNRITPAINVGQEIKVKKSVIRDYTPVSYPDRL